MPDGEAVIEESLIWLLRQAWARWHHVEYPVGLRAQLDWILHNTPEGQAGRPSDAVGVTPGTGNAWLSYAIGFRDRQGHRVGRPPNRASVEKIQRVLARARRPTDRLPTRAVVTACIIWDGYANGRSGRIVGQPPSDLIVQTRTTTFDGLNLYDSSNAWARFDDWAAAEDFNDAVFDRYGVVVDLWEPSELELKR